MPRTPPPKRDPRYPDFPTIVHALAYAAERHPDAPAIACLDRELTYGQYAQAVAALAETLADHDVAGERVAYLMRNSLEMVIGLYAGMAARAQIAALNPAYTDREIEPQVRDIDPRVIVCESEFSGRAMQLAQLTGRAKVIVLGAEHISIDQLLSG